MVRARAHLQSFGDLAALATPRTPAFRAPPNAVNPEAAYLAARQLPKTASNHCKSASDATAVPTT